MPLSEKEIQERITHIRAILAQASDPRHELKNSITKFYIEALRREEARLADFQNEKKIARPLMPAGRSI